MLVIIWNQKLTVRMDNRLIVALDFDDLGQVKLLENCLVLSHGSK